MPENRTSSTNKNEVWLFSSGLSFLRALTDGDNDKDHIEAACWEKDWTILKSTFKGQYEIGCSSCDSFKLLYNRILKPWYIKSAYTYYRGNKVFEQDFIIELKFGSI